ncbi:MAG: molecular chaperone DnaJ [Planctomycetota bacterium]|nr:molecular chaperone DnaJ [Planctomycetota bacterium]MDA1252526.1 molecular chaperone DnaJ [Planctomycetota bacterium]
MAAQRDYYEVLGVSRDAAPDVIKKAFKKLAIKFHPDRNPGDDAAVESFKEASQAYDVLSNEEKRARYNRFGHEGVRGAAGGGGGFQDVNDIFDVFGDLFEGFGFGGGKRRGGGRRPVQGESIKTRVSIDLLEAAKGCTKPVTFERQEHCETCAGSGAAPGTTPDKCDYCGGAGHVVQSQGFFRMQTSCPACRGEGSVVREKCGDCRGSGRKSISVTRDANIPAGVDTGMHLVLRGVGEPGQHGGPAGDVYVEVTVAEHPLFRREGLDLICDVPISYTQAALGADIEVPCLEGKTQHHVYPGTQPGEIVRIRGGGMPDPRGGRPGDLLLRIVLEVPKKINAEQEAVLRDLAKLEHAAVSPHRSSFFDKLKDWFVPDETD